MLYINRSSGELGTHVATCFGPDEGGDDMMITDDSITADTDFMVSTISHQHAICLKYSQHTCHLPIEVVPA
jgi:hypothetical protein